MSSRVTPLCKPMPTNSGACSRLVRCSSRWWKFNRSELHERL
jgi:hypothetical protein